MYEIEWSEQARADLKALPPFWRRRVGKAVAHLAYQAEIENRKRKRLRKRLRNLVDAEWNLRIGDLRVLYQVLEERTVRVLRVIFKGSDTTDDALRRVSHED